MGTTTRQGQARRLLVEGVVIVISILLAFALDAWWDAQQRASETDALLVALLSEFDASVAEFDRVAQRNEEVILAADEVISVLQNSSGAIRIDPALLGDLVLTPTMDPPRGTLDAMLSAGELALLNDQELKSLLAAWPARVADIQEEEEAARKFVHEQLIPHLTEVTDLRPAFDYRIGRFLVTDRGALADDLVLPGDVGVVVTGRLTNLVATRRFFSMAIQATRPTVRETLDEIRERIRDRLD